jgi:hypothetical protein
MPLGDLVLGDRGDRETFEDNSSILSLVFTLKESSESLMATISETRDSFMGLWPCAFAARGDGDRASDPCGFEFDIDAPLVLSLRASTYWAGDSSVLEDDTELPHIEEERYG